MEKYMEIYMFLCLHVKNVHKSTKTSMYFLHLVLTFTSHFIIMSRTRTLDGGGGGGGS